MQVFKQGALKHHCNYSDAGYLAEIEILDDSIELWQQTVLGSGLKNTSKLSDP